MTLGEILARMAALDESLDALDPAECEDLARSLEIKVDSYFAVIEEYKAKAQKLEGKIKLLEKAKAHAKRMERWLESVMIRHMEIHGFTRLPGVDFSAKLRRSSFVEIDASIANPDSDIYRRFSHLMRRTYEWDKIALRNEMKNSSAVVHEGIRLKTRWHLDFEGNKET